MAIGPLPEFAFVASVAALELETVADKDDAVVVTAKEGTEATGWPKIIKNNNLRTKLLSSFLTIRDEYHVKPLGI